MTSCVKLKLRRCGCLQQKAPLPTGLREAMELFEKLESKPPAS
jgi:hypothetical protein